MTLSDKEQRELYQAAQIIQKAFRSYKGRKQDPTSREARDRSSSAGPGGLSEAEAEQNKEVKAASVIQNYYRRYKQVSLNTVPNILSYIITLLPPAVASLNYFPVPLFIFFLS